MSAKFICVMAGLSIALSLSMAAKSDSNTNYPYNPTGVDNCDGSQSTTSCIKTLSWSKDSGTTLDFSFPDDVRRGELQAIDLGVFTGNGTRSYNVVVTSPNGSAHINQIFRFAAPYLNLSSSSESGPDFINICPNEPGVVCAPFYTFTASGIDYSGPGVTDKWTGVASPFNYDPNNPSDYPHVALQHDN